MKILMINKFFFIKGGSETYYFSLKELLEKNGHTVIDFSMQDDRNFESEYSNFFVKKIDYNIKQCWFSKVKNGLKIIYSFEAKRKLEKLIKQTKPDIAHLHIFQHQLSLSILDILKKYNIPIVYTAHDLKMICPNYKMLTHEIICEKCKEQKYFNCLKNKCIKDSVVKSAIAMSEAYINKWRKAYDKIDYIITPSKFYMDKFIEFGINKNRLMHISNFLNTNRIEYDILSKQEYFLYFGRLSEEKGIITLIKAMKDIDSTLKIVGAGPLKDYIERYIKDNSCNNIEILGFKEGKGLNTIIANAKAVIIPSEWYENGPYSGIEALKLKRPLIGSNLGGIPELIEGNGYIFKHGNIEDLHQKLKNFQELFEQEIEEMQEKSYEIFQKRYTDKVHYDKLIEVYKKICRNQIDDKNIVKTTF